MAVRRASLADRDDILASNARHEICSSLHLLLKVVAERARQVITHSSPRQALAIAMNRTAALAAKKRGRPTANAEAKAEAKVKTKTASSDATSVKTPGTQ